jgi:hypothetical protein
MTPETITAIAYLLVSAANAGVRISSILAEVKASGKVSDETWLSIIDQIEQAEEDWHNA